MYHTAHIPRILFLQNVHGICRRFPGVDDHGFILLPGQVQLPSEPVPLDLPVHVVPVVIQADLAHGHCFWMGQSPADSLQDLFRHGAAVGRVDPQGAVHKGIALRQIQAFLYAFNIGSDVADPADPRLLKGGKDLLPVFTELLVIIVRMCIEYHVFSPRMSYAF